MSHYRAGPLGPEFRVNLNLRLRVMSENIDPENARLVDTEYLVRRSMTKGYQLFSIITPPIYAGLSLFRKGRAHLTMNRLLRATCLGGVAGRHRRMV
jgi:hypothetical protein